MAINKLNMYKKIKRILDNSIDVKRQILSDEKLLSTIEKVTELCIIAFKADKKLLFCGNGGSASDAQHIACEFTGKFYIDRKGLNAEALGTNIAYATAVSNDYSFDELFARQVECKGKQGDILFGLSTSGNSKNVIRAFEEARKKHLITIAMTGALGGTLAGLADFVINVPSVDTPRIQESHITIGHIICELVEQRIFKPQIPTI